jgi:hypothetical protein
MKLFNFIVVFFVSFLLFACSSQNLDQYSSTSPTLDLKEFFNGELVAYGMLQNRSGVLTRRFTATIDASWDGDKGTLVEEFLFDDGEIQYRTWALTDLGNNNYQGVAGDVLGEAEGSIVGSVFQWQYQLDVPYGDGTIVLSLDDWLYLIDDNHLINKTKLTKFGFKVGELTLVIEKV